MPQDLHSLLHMYRLRSRQTVRLKARSDLHSSAHIRMHPEDVADLAHPADSTKVVVALFSTSNTNEAVCIRSAENIYVCLNNSTPKSNLQWVSFRVTASHAYVRGMRVSGTIHRSVLRLVRE